MGRGSLEFLGMGASSAGGELEVNLFGANEVHRNKHRRGENDRTNMTHPDWWIGNKRHCQRNRDALVAAASVD